MPIYRRITWGDLAELSVLDTRRYRSAPPCGYGEAPRYDATLESRPNMTRPEQEQWLLKGLDRSRARWNFIAQQVLMAQLDHDGAAGDIFWNDSWDGYVGARTRIIRHLHDHRIDNPVNHHRRLALDVRERHQARLRRSAVDDRRRRVRHAIAQLERRRGGLRPVLRPDDPLQPAHPLLRR
jgi:phosphodiesterase/alkaline phosphatase D-like protein